MTDTAQPQPATRGPGLLHMARAFMASDSLVGRALILAALTLGLKIPLGMVGGVIADRQNYQSEAVRNVADSWGGPQTFIGPILVVPYTSTDSRNWRRTLALLPDKLTIDSRVNPEQRRRGLFAVNVYAATVDVTAEFQTKALRELLAEGRLPEWGAAHLDVGLSQPKSIDGSTVEVGGQPIDWASGAGTPFSSLQAPLGAVALADKETVTVRFRLTFGGSGSLAFAPLGRHTDASMASSWPSPSFAGRYLPLSQSVSQDGFSAKWSTSHLGRGYGQIWDSAASSDPATSTVVSSAFCVTLFNPVDAYRETDRAIKYAIMFIGLTFTACLLFEMATGTRPHAAQYGLVGLSLCVFYLLLLSLSEQIGFGPAYLVSASAVVAQAAIYNWALQRRRGPALAFGAILAGLYGGLYGLLQLEDVALLSGSLLLFAVLSLAMWFTRNLHRARPA